MTSTAPSELPTVTLVETASAEPLRKILTQDDMQQWLRSEAYSNIERFIERLRTASETSGEGNSSQAVVVVVEFLERIGTWINEAATAGSPASRGKAFKSWLARVEEASSVFNHDLVSPSQAAALPELQFHLVSSFGSAIRLDYGTGHELSFLAYLLILRLISVLKQEDEPAIVKRCFVTYRDVVGKLQKAFKLEAAGKMGVWGVDERGHLVYHFGASQSRIHPSKRPASLLAPPSLTPNSISYLYLSTLFHLNDSFDPSTKSDNGDGLLGLYRSEVLQRLPVVQHFRFGAVLRWLDAATGDALPSSSDGLSEEERQALDATLDKRERDVGTVAPWAIPSLSGTQTPEEILTRLPSPAVGSSSRPTTPKDESAPPSPVTPSSTGSGSPVPRPYSTPHRLGQRRMSRLSISESADGGEEEKE
ncbi:hypothetical protein JCM6882_007610 [Rhodosporidiobolus microsporus]